MSDYYSEKVICAFLENYKVADVIEAAGISRGTYYALKKNADFQELIQELRDDLLRSSLNQMRDRLSHNMDVLQGIIDDPDAKPQVKINALSLYLSKLGDWTDRMNTAERLKQYENYDDIFDFKPFLKNRTSPPDA